MTLRLRLLLATLVLSLAITLVFGLVIRSAWQRAETERFETEFKTTVTQLEAELSDEAVRIQTALKPLCDHDPILDSAVIGVQSNTLPSRLLSLRARVPELRKSLGLNELALIASGEGLLAGEIEASDQKGEAPEVRLRRRKLSPGFRDSEIPGFEAACMKKEGRAWVGLIGSTHLLPMLDRAARQNHLSLSLSPPAQSEQTLSRALPLDTLKGNAVYATRSRRSLRATFSDLDSVVLTVAAGTFGAALFFAFLLSRGLSRPVVLFAERTREAVRGRVHELPESGGPELSEAARSFNATLRDLDGLRTRLQVTEKIAARREVARQIAHEIKNPLSPIRTSIETLQKLKLREHPEFDHYFEETTRTVLKEVKRISTLVGHFSEYARLPAPTVSPLNLAALAHEIAALHENLGAIIEFSADEVPDVPADRDQVTQVLTNLIKNALEATRDVPNARVRIQVSRNSETGTAGVCCRVSDNGVGVKKEEEALLFEPYATTKKDGTGLGLPISHRIAVEHGGDLTYKTGSEGGAEFVLFLPTSGPPEMGPKQ